MAHPPRILIVGAGAVGQVFARHLILGGASVTFFVREKYVASLRPGFDMYPLNMSDSIPVLVKDFQVVSTVAEIKNQQFDQVYLTVSSEAIRGPWLKTLCEAIGNATVISLQSTRDDVAVIRQAGVPDEQLVCGLIVFTSYAAPLPGETRFPKAGTAYWFPPFSACQFSGKTDRVLGVIAALKQGGLRAGRQTDIHAASAFFTSMLQVYLAVLECADWDFSRALESRRAKLGSHAAREVASILKKLEGHQPFIARVLTWPWAIRFGIMLAKAIVPFPLELFIQKHFTKVNGQTHLILKNLCADAQKQGISVPALTQVIADVEGGSRPVKS